QGLVSLRSANTEIVDLLENAKLLGQAAGEWAAGLVFLEWAAADDLSPLSLAQLERNLAKDDFVDCLAQLLSEHSWVMALLRVPKFVELVLAFRPTKGPMIVVGSIVQAGPRVRLAGLAKQFTNGAGPRFRHSSLGRFDTVEHFPFFFLVGLSPVRLES